MHIDYSSDFTAGYLVGVILTLLIRIQFFEVRKVPWEETKARTVAVTLATLAFFTIFMTWYGLR